MKQPQSHRNVIALADLSPRKDVKGGSRVRIFGTDSPTDERRSVMKGKIVKDLPPKSTSNIKGGRRVD